MKRLGNRWLVVGVVIILGLAVVWHLWDKREEVDFATIRDAWSGVNSVNNSNAIEKALQELLENNEETRAFVENYPNRADYMNLEIDLAEEILDGEVPLFMQWDMRWGYEAYGDNIIALAGCGPTCLSMAYVYLTGDLEGNPREMARYAEEEGFHTKEGTDWSLWTVGVKDLGLVGEELSLEEGKIVSALDNGGLVVCSMRPGDFTRTGHYILIKGYDKNGFYINDPNSVANSERQWNYEDIKGQIKNLWGIWG